MAQTTLAMSARNGVVEMATAFTLANGAANAAQKVITVDSSAGMLAGDTLEYMLVGGVIEQNVIDVVDSGTQVTMTTNIGTGGIADNEQVTRIVIISGTANAVTVSGGNRVNGEAYTAAGDTALLTYGKREPEEITFRGVYTETSITPEFYEELQTLYASGAGAGLRWSPTAYTTVNQKRFWTTDTTGTYIRPGIITAWNFPSLDFSSGDPITCEFTVRSAAIGTTDHSA